PCVTDHGDRARTGHAVVGFLDGAAEKCRNAEHGKVAAGNQIDVYRLVSPAGNGGLGRQLNTENSGDAGKRGLLLLKVMKERIGEEPGASIGNSSSAPTRPAVSEQHQFLRIVHRERTEQDGVEQREDSGVGANAQAEREDGDGREPWAPPQLTNSETQVLEKVVGDRFPARR